jgi:acyl carrier protein
MSSPEMIEALRAFILRDLRWSGSASALTADYPLIQNHVVDSLGLLLLVSYLEDELGVIVADEDLVPDNFATLGKIVTMIDKKRGSEERAG